MKRRVIRLGLSLLVIILASCTETKSERELNKAGEEVRDAQEELDQAQREYAEEVEEYRQSMQTDIDNNKLEIARLRERRINDRADVIRKRNERIDELQRRYVHPRADSFFWNKNTYQLQANRVPICFGEEEIVFTI